MMWDIVVVCFLIFWALKYEYMHIEVVRFYDAMEKRVLPKCSRVHQTR
jgi:hypothetical protein